MVERQIRARGVADERVLEAMRRVPRHLFVDDDLVAESYEDHPVPIGKGQTVSQPYIVAFMLEALRLGSGARVLEVGTGRGYQAAVLAEMGLEVFTVEIIPELAEEASRLLSHLGFDRIHVECRDGSLGWPEESPYDGIVVAAAPQELPESLLEQLAPGGRLVIPIGGDVQELWLYRRTPSGFQAEELLPVRFVPLIVGRRPARSRERDGDERR
jgi:protein-L-isoaspartate(D-aspartate) O-methyltransferase